MIIVLAKHEPYDDGHLGRVVDEMRLTGAPTIRVVRFDGHWIALEGSHRLAAAHHLLLAPKLVELSVDVETPAPHWRRLLRQLPRYAFDKALVLDLRHKKRPPAPKGRRQVGRG